MSSSFLCLLNEEELYDELHKIRSLLNSKAFKKSFDQIKFESFNKEEAMQIKSYLTEEEKTKIFFTWLKFH